MGVKVFVLGRPGSGKSTAAHHLNHLFQCQNRSAQHFNDYDILLEMFLADTEHKKFRATEHNGFDAIDLSVLDDALKILETRIQREAATADLVTIEFARDDYREALRQFSPAFLKDAYILFLDADLETCIRRVHDRVEHAVTDDDHPSFSDDIFRWYYARDNKPYMSRFLRTEFGIRKAVKIIDNTGSLTSFLNSIELFANGLFVQENGLLAPALNTGR